MNMPNFLCLEMLLGLYQTFVGESLNLLLNRLNLGAWKLQVMQIFCCFYCLIFPCIICADKARSSSSWASHSFNWWGSPDRRMLGIVIFVWWYKWQNTSCYWSWCLSSSCRAPNVSNCFLFLFFYFIDLLYSESDSLWTVCVLPGIHRLLSSFLPYVQLEILWPGMMSRLRYWIWKSQCFWLQWF